MAEKRLIDADEPIAFIERTCCNGCKNYEGARCRACDHDDAIAMIEDAPTVDAVEVVRCMDCKHSTLPAVLTQRYGEPGTLTCHNARSPCNKRNVKSDGFCPYGERKCRE